MDEQPNSADQHTPRTAAGALAHRPWMSNPSGPFTRRDLEFAEQLSVEHPLGNLAAGTCGALVHGDRPTKWPCQTLRWSDLVRLAARRGRIPGIPAS